MSWGTSWGVSWGDSWGSVGSGIGVSIPAGLLESLSGLYNPEYKSGAEKLLDLLESVSTLFDAGRDLETAIWPDALSAEAILKLYGEISLGSGNIITLGFIDGHHVLELGPTPPWAPETDLDTGGEIHVGIEYDTTVLDSETVLFSPDIEMGQLVELLEMESTQPSISVYGDAIYSWALGSGTWPMSPEIDARQSCEAIMGLLEHVSTAHDVSPYAWHRIDTSTLLVQSTVNPSTVDTDCAIMSPIVAMESYVFMCRLIRDGAPDTPPIYD